MKIKNSPRTISFIASLILASIFFLGFLFTFELQDLHWIRLLIFYICTVLAGYFIIFFSIKQFIYSKINVIYRTFHHLSSKKKTIDFSENILTQLNEDVLEWDKLRKAQIQKLKEQDSFRKEFIGNLAHELKTPTFAAQGYILTLLDGALEDPKVNELFLRKADNAIERMAHLINELDTITKLETSKLELNITKFNFVKLAYDVLEGIEYKAGLKHIKIHFDFTPQDQYFVLADEHQISKVLNNLLVNAIKYGEEKGNVWVRIFEMDDHTLIEIEDDGIGIPKDDLSRVFERFFRVDKSRHRDTGGSGLGLAICKHIIDVHSEIIQVRPAKVKGTIFNFSLKKAK